MYAAKHALLQATHCLSSCINFIVKNHTWKQVIIPSDNACIYIWHLHVRLIALYLYILKHFIPVSVLGLDIECKKLEWLDYNSMETYCVNSRSGSYSTCTWIVHMTWNGLQVIEPTYISCTVRRQCSCCPKKHRVILDSEMSTCALGMEDHAQAPRIIQRSHDSLLPHKECQILLFPLLMPSVWHLWHSTSEPLWIFQAACQLSWCSEVKFSARKTPNGAC